jgi:hypothetical protein
MREKKIKSEFVKDIEKRINLRKEILDFVENVYFPMMALKFNGKVYNKRFINALNEEGKKMNEYLYVREREYDHIEISVRVSPYNYTDCETIYVKCNLTNDGRIDYDSTINDKVGQAWIENFKKNTDEHQSTIDHYDDYCKVFEELESVVKRYNDLPYPFRRNMDAPYLRIY